MQEKRGQDFLTVIDGLERRIADLELSNSLKTKWIGMLVHDARGFLTNVMWLVDHQEHLEIDEHTFNGLLQELRANAANQLEGFNNVAAWVWENGTYAERNCKPMDLEAILVAAVNELAFAAKRKSVHVAVRSHTAQRALGNVHLTRFVLKQVLDNAIKYSEPRQEVSVEIVERDRGGLHIVVTDYGIGMAEETLARIYQPDKSKYLGTMGEKGSGMTLLMCKDFMEMQGGRLYTRSDLGEGTEVTMEFAL